jgi:single-strand DNA-binding protein
MNNVLLMGRLTKDPELQKTSKGESICKFNLAVDNHGNETDFIPCVAFKSNADNISKYMSKGQQFIVEGRLQSNTYNDQEGKRKTSYSVVVGRFYFTADKGSKQPIKNVPNEPTVDEVADDIKEYFDKYEGLDF